MKSIVLLGTKDKYLEVNKIIGDISHLVGRDIEFSFIERDTEDEENFLRDNVCSCRYINTAYVCDSFTDNIVVGFEDQIFGSDINKKNLLSLVMGLPFDRGVY